MARDLASEVDALRADVHDLAHTVRMLLNQDPADATANSLPQEGFRPPTDWPGMTVRQPDDLIRSAKEQKLSGAVSYAGFYASGADDESRESRWISDFRSADDLLAQDDNAVARVLAALGNRQRLALLKAILQKPATAAELVERLGMGTTGQAYHHLKALQAADLIEQEERGLFVFKGPRVQAFMLLLAGVRDMLDTRYSSGVWAGEADI